MSCPALTYMLACRPSCYYDVEEAYRRDQCSSLTAMPVAGAKGEILGAVCLGLQQNINLSSKWVPLQMPCQAFPLVCWRLPVILAWTMCAVPRQSNLGAYYHHIRC